MPRNPENPDQWIAGKLPEITHNGKQYFVDGRLKELRNTENHADKFQPDDLQIDAMTEQDREIVMFQFYGV